MAGSLKTPQKQGAFEQAPFFMKAIAALILGIVLSFIQAPFNYWFLIFPCLGGFYFIYLYLPDKKQVFAASFLFALGYFVTGLNWIGNALLVEGNDYKWVWPLAVIALPTLLASFTALYITISHIIFSKHRLSGFLGFCALLSLSEWVRGYVFTGFPWNLYGYGWSGVLPMLQSLSIIGPYGLTLLSVFWGCLLGFLFSPTEGKKLLLVMGMISLAAVYIWGDERLKAAQTSNHLNLRVHIIQPNIDQADKWKPEKLAENFENFLVLSSDRKFERRNIYIWPETALPPSFLHSLAVKERLKGMLADDSILLTGALQAKPDDQNPQHIEYYNGLYLFDGKNVPERLYAKSHLVPFGEYIPFQKYIPLKPVVEFTGFQKGLGARTTHIGTYPSFTTLICYEIIFPHQVVDKNSARPDYILTITNDAWYGDSSGPYQHFAQARFRAIEQGLPVVRSANTGISGLIDPYGRVVEKTALLESASVTVRLPHKLERATFYSLHGDKIYIALFIFFFGMAVLGKIKKLT